MPKVLCPVCHQSYESAGGTQAGAGACPSCARSGGARKTALVPPPPPPRATSPQVRVPPPPSMRVPPPPVPPAAKVSPPLPAFKTPPAPKPAPSGPSPLLQAAFPSAQGAAPARKTTAAVSFAAGPSTPVASATPRPAAPQPILPSQFPPDDERKPLPKGFKGEKIWQRFLIGVGILAALIVFTIWASTDGYRSWKRSAFAGALDSFVDAKNIQEPRDPSWRKYTPRTSRYSTHAAKEVVPEFHDDKATKGPVLVIDSESREVDEAYFQMHSDWRASDPEDVTLVVLLKWEPVKVDSYIAMSGPEKGKHIGNAIREDVHVTAIDWKERRVVGRTFIEGYMPSSVTVGKGDRQGGRPYYDIIEFIGKFAP